MDANADPKKEDREQACAANEVDPDKVMCPRCDYQFNGISSRHKEEFAILHNGGIIEIAVCNASVSEYMRHWEGRAIKAETDLQQAEKDKLDARRYRWLKSNHLQTSPDSWIRTGADLEEAIDAALTGTKP